MKLSNKARYGVRAVFDIAFHSRGEATQIKDIAERQSIPPRFLEQIFGQLKRAGLVSSKRGPKGGYRLARDPAVITIGEVIVAIEGPVSMTGSDSTPSPGSQATGSQIVSEEALDALGKELLSCMDRVSFQALCDRGDALGLRDSNARALVYSI